MCVESRMMNVEHAQYLVVIMIAIASCLLHALFVRKFLLPKLYKSFSQRLIINSVFYMMLTIGSLLVSAYLIIFDATKGVFVAFY